MEEAQVDTAESDLEEAAATPTPQVIPDQAASAAVLVRSAAVDTEEEAD